MEYLQLINLPYLYKPEIYTEKIHEQRKWTKAVEQDQFLIVDELDECKNNQNDFRILPICWNNWKQVTRIPWIWQIHQKEATTDEKQHVLKYAQKLLPYLRFQVLFSQILHSLIKNFKGLIVQKIKAAIKFQNSILDLRAIHICFLA